MKAITLHQPWASLVALGVKQIETRSWTPPKACIGERLLIHAGSRPLPVGGVNCPPKVKRDGSQEERDAVNHQTWHAINTITDPEFQGLQPCNPKTGRQRRIPKRAQTPTLFWPHAGPWHRPREGKPEFTHTEYLPLGAIVASCILADAVPMIEMPHMMNDWPAGRWVGVARWPDADHPLIVAARQPENVDKPGPGPGDEWHSLADQRPYGHFAPGRWAWLLEDVKPTTERCPACWGSGFDTPYPLPPFPEGGRNHCSICDGRTGCPPIAAKGHQRIWNWEP